MKSYNIETFSIIKMITKRGIRRKVKKINQFLSDLYDMISFCICRFFERLIPRREFQPNLSYKEHEGIYGLANVLDVKQDDQHGRYIIAKRNVDIGSVILSAKAFASVVTFKKDKQDYCLTCKQQVAIFISCRTCSQVKFCCRECRSMNEVHPLECGTEYSEINEPILKLVIQMILVAIKVFKNCDEMMEFVKGSSANKRYGSNRGYDLLSRYEVLLNIPNYPNEQDEHRANHALLVANRMPIFVAWFNTVQKQRVLYRLLRHHIGIIRTHAFEDSISDNLQLTNIYDSLSMLSHSCAPNVHYGVINGIAYCMAIRPIKRGDQLFVNCLNDAIGKIAEHRQSVFRNIYGRLCDCERCNPNTPQIINMKEMYNDDIVSYIYRHFGDQFESLGSRKRHRMTIECANFIRKYGHVWTLELQKVINCYVSAVTGK